MLRKTLLLLMFFALLFAAPASYAQAQGASGGVDTENAPEISDSEGGFTASFPHPGPYGEHWIYEVLGFEQSFRLFKLASGRSTNSTTSLYYLTLTVGMLGLILIILNRKFQEPATMGCWFLITFIMVIGPYGSKLFFYPLGATTNQGTQIYAFTPQLAAIHITNILHTAVHDVLFACSRNDNNQVNCNVRNGVSDIVNASAISGLNTGQKKLEDPAIMGMAHLFSSLGCGQPEMLTLAPYNENTFNAMPTLFEVDQSSGASTVGGDQQCAMLENNNQIPASLMSVNTASQADEDGVTTPTGVNSCGLPRQEYYWKRSRGFTFNDVMEAIVSFYQAGLHDRDISVPFAVTFSAANVGVDGESVTVSSPESKYVASEETQEYLEEGQISAWRAGYSTFLKSRPEIKAFNARAHNDANNAIQQPAFFLAADEQAKTLISNSKDTRIPGIDEATYSGRAANLVTTPSNANGRNVEHFSAEDLNFAVMTRLRFSTGRVAPDVEEGDDPRVLLASTFNGITNNINILEMPVKVGMLAPIWHNGLGFGQTTVNVQTGFNGNKRSYWGLRKENGLAKPVANCAELHRVIHRRMLLYVYDNIDTPVDDVMAMLGGPNTTAPYQPISSYFVRPQEGWNVASENAALRSHMQLIIRELQRAGDNHNANGADTGLPQMRIFTDPNNLVFNDYTEYLQGQPDLANFLREQMNADLMKNALQSSPEVRTVAATAVGAGDDPFIGGTQADSVMGWLGGPLGTVGGWLAQIGVMVFSWIAGALTPIYIKFLIIVTKIAIMSAILVTPLLLLMGMAIPGNAPGVLILTIGSIFVLKFIPITFTVIDALFTLVMDLVRGITRINWTAGLGFAAAGGGAGAAAGAVAAGVVGVIAAVPIAVGVGAVGLFSVANDSIERSLVVIAAAMAYTSATGLTLFLLFKVGDPMVLQNLTQLDNMSKDVAEKGIEGAKKAVGIAGKSGVAGAAGFVGAGTTAWQESSKEEKKSGFAGLKAARAGMQGLIGKSMSEATGGTLGALGVTSEANDMLGTWAKNRAGAREDYAYKKQGDNAFIKGVSGKFRDAEAQADKEALNRAMRGGLRDNFEAIVTMSKAQIADGNLSESEAHELAAAINNPRSNSAGAEGHAGRAERGQVDVDPYAREGDRGSTIEKLAILSHISSKSVEDLLTDENAMQEAIQEAAEAGYLKPGVDADGNLTMGSITDTGDELVRSGALKKEQAAAEVHQRQARIFNTTSAVDFYSTNPFAEYNEENFTEDEHKQAEQHVRNQANRAGHEGEKRVLTRLADLMQKSRTEGLNKDEQVEMEAILSTVQGGGALITAKEAATEDGKKQIALRKALGHNVTTGKDGTVYVSELMYVREGGIRQIEDRMRMNHDKNQRETTSTQNTTDSSGNSSGGGGSDGGGDNNNGGGSGNSGGSNNPRSSAPTVVGGKSNRDAPTSSFNTQPTPRESRRSDSGDNKAAPQQKSGTQPRLQTDGGSTKLSKQLDDVIKSNQEAAQRMASAVDNLSGKIDRLGSSISSMDKNSDPVVVKTETPKPDDGEDKS